ncbi:MAG: glycosyltransferase [Candidatus Altiarchaeales archaeon]|nr:glycosyltransferase [Candidatus Altiarchaeales archaeon]MBD3415631.1 glycosyltransferase [Candidatus Altiarchaeales archaeon]
MRIGLTSIVFNKQGGISRYVVELASRLAPDHEVHILTSRYEDKVPGVIAHEEPIVWNPISLQVASNAWRNVGKIKRLREGGVDVVNSQGAEAVNSDIVTMQSCQKAAVRKFGEDRGPAYALLKALEPRNNVVLSIEKKILNRSKRVIAISESIKDEVVENYGIPGEKVRVIYSGVNLEEFNPKKKEEARREVRSKHGLGEDDIVLSFSGWEFKRKGLKYIIEALPGLDRNIKLVVVGAAESKPYKSLAERKSVGDRIVFAGHSNNISEYYAASDIFVFPTAYEPFGLVITEAMATGIPVVTTRSAGAAELITDGVDGMLLDSPYSSEEIVEKIRHILDNDLLSDMGVRARKTAERYSWESVTDQTLEVYGELVD